MVVAVLRAMGTAHSARRLKPLGHLRRNDTERLAAHATLSQNPPLDHRNRRNI